MLNKHLSFSCQKKWFWYYSYILNTKQKLLVLTDIFDYIEESRLNVTIQCLL